MLDVATAKEAIRRECDATLGVLEPSAPQDWERPVRCEGWRVADLAAHLVSGQTMQVQALQRMVQGSSEPASMSPVDAAVGREVLLSELRDARAALDAVLDEVSEDIAARVCPLPYAPIPTGMALQIFVMEAGVHHDDLLDALGTKRALSADVVDATSTVLAALLPVMAAGGPDPGDGYVLHGSSVQLALRYTSDGWQTGTEPTARLATVSGDDSAVLRFALGRIGSDDPALSVSGDADLASTFKRYFPGP